MRNAVRDSIAELTKLAIALECHLYVMETQKIVAADVDLLLSHLAKSSAVKFAHDPKGYVERIARETGE